MALREALPTLKNNKKARQIVNGFASVVVNDVLPIVALNAVNNGVQNYFREGYEEDQASTAYSLFITALTLGNYLVTSISWHQGSQVFVRVAVLDSFAPAAFNSNKKTLPPSICDDECNIQRRIKGSAREVPMLWAGELLAYGANMVPYVGLPLSKTIAIINNGRYITKAVTEERCERHKYVEPEFALAAGLTLELSSLALDKALEATVGPMPFLYMRALKHILLAFSVNTAAHMNVPLVLPKNATIPDPFHYYEWAWRFYFDVLWAGLLVRVPIDFKPAPNESPLLSLDSTLRVGTEVLRSDLETEVKSLPNPWVKKAKDWVIPPMFRSAYDFPKDRVVAKYWPDIREGGINIFEGIQVYSKNKGVRTLVWSPENAARILHHYLGIPEGATKIAIRVFGEQKFAGFTVAAQSWLRRHPSSLEIKSTIALLSGNKEDVPVIRRGSETIPAHQLLEEPKSPSSTITEITDLLPSGSNVPVTELDISSLIPEMPLVAADSPLRFLGGARARKKQEQTLSIEELFADDDTGLKIY